VAAALLRVALHKDLSIVLVRSQVERFQERLDDLRRDGDPEINPMTGEEASAWIEYLQWCDDVRPWQATSCAKATS
jgi:hypothetical protein